MYLNRCMFERTLKIEQNETQVQYVIDTIAIILKIDVDVTDARVGVYLEVCSGVVYPKLVLS